MVVADSKESAAKQDPPPVPSAAPPTVGNCGIQRVVIHPMVLLSVVDHFHRTHGVTPGGQARVVGLLLGSLRKGVLDVANSFALPFDEDPKDPNVFYCDHDYLESMYNMFKKVNAKERIVGWYHTGPKLRPNDINVNEMIRKYTSNSVLIVIDAVAGSNRRLPASSQGDSSAGKSKAPGVTPLGDGESHYLPTEAYVMVEEVHDDGTPTVQTFEHLPTEIGAEEAEEVGVEHLLRDIKSNIHGTLSQRVTRQMAGLGCLFDKLHEVETYLDRVIAGTLPVNHQIVYELQDVLNLLPDVTMTEFTHSLQVKTNDQMAVLYLSSIVRSIAALHNLVNNKINNKTEETKAEETKKEGKKATQNSSTPATTTPATDSEAPPSKKK